MLSVGTVWEPCQLSLLVVKPEPTSKSLETLFFPSYITPYPF
jgi:hypothetical protein